MTTSSTTTLEHVARVIEQHHPTRKFRHPTAHEPGYWWCHGCKRELTNEERALHQALVLQETRLLVSAIDRDHVDVGSRVQVSEYRVRPTGYETSSLVDKQSFELTINERGTDPLTGLKRWAVVRGRQCLDAEGTPRYEPRPSARTDEFISQTRFSEPQARALALKHVDRLRINGRTFAEWESFETSTSTSPP